MSLYGLCIEKSLFGNDITPGYIYCIDLETETRYIINGVGYLKNKFIVYPEGIFNTELFKLLHG